MCSSKTRSEAISLTYPCILDCDFSLSSNVYVKSKSPTYLKPGGFYCAEPGQLYNTNGTIRKETATTCLITAKWKDEENVRCGHGNYMKKLTLNQFRFFICYVT